MGTSFRKGVKATRGKPLVDLVGKKYGRLVVLKQADNINGRISWLCKCECGNTKVVAGHSLQQGLTTSCGCYRSEYLRKKATKHNLCDSRIYDIYNNMKRRCYDKKCDHYKWYGSENKTVCSEWLGKDGFLNFSKWAFNNGYSDELTIDRIDNSKGYSPDNCRWVTPKENCRNKRNNSLHTLNGETKTLTEWAEIYNIPFARLQARLKNGWDFETALTTPKLR